MVLGLTPCLDPNHPITGQIFTWAYLGLEEHLHSVLTQMGKEVLRSGSLIPESAGWCWEQWRFILLSPLARWNSSS